MNPTIVTNVGTNQGFSGASGVPASSVHTLQQLLAPRRPAPSESNPPFPVTSQAAREPSIGSVSTGNSSLWESPQQGVSASYAHHAAVHLAPAAIPGPQYTTTSVYSGNPTPRLDPFTGQHPSQQQQTQGAPGGHQLPGGLPSVPVSYHDPNTSFTPDPRRFGPPGGYC